MRAIWKGAVSFGLVNVPVRLFAATQEHDIRFHQVHREDGGRIRMKRTCSIDGEEVAYDQIAKGYESPDGRLVILDDEDFASLPLRTGREIEVVEFVPVEQVDPIMYGRTYYLEPEARAAKPYVLLREALEATQRLAVVKVAMRQRESLAVLRVRDRVIVLQTLLWPDEVRVADFDILDQDVELRPQELTMAQSLIESLASDFEPDAFEDDYSTALAELVDAKLEGAPPVPAAEVEAGRAPRWSTCSPPCSAASRRRAPPAVRRPRRRGRRRGEDGRGEGPGEEGAARGQPAAKKAPREDRGGDGAARPVDRGQVERRPRRRKPPGEDDGGQVDRGQGDGGQDGEGHPGEGHAREEGSGQDSREGDGEEDGDAALGLRGACAR